MLIFFNQTIFIIAIILQLDFNSIFIVSKINNSLFYLVLNLQ